MNEELKRALEAAKKAQHDFEAATERTNKDLEAQGRVSAEMQAKVDRIDADVMAKLAEAQARFDELERKIARDQALGGNSAKDAFTLEIAAFNRMMAQEFRLKSRAGRQYVAVDGDHYRAYKDGFAAYLRLGAAAFDMDPDFRSAMSIGSDPDGGYIVPADTSGRLVGFINETSELRKWANVSTTQRDAKEGRLDIMQAGAEWVGEKSTRSRTSTPQLGKYRIPVHEQHANLPVTQNEIEDAGEDVEGWLARKAAEQFSIAENTSFVSGNGVTRPKGFTQYSAGTPSNASYAAFAKILQVATGHASSFKADPSGPDIFKDLAANLKGQYLARAAWAMKRLTLGAARKLKDSNGQYQVLLDRDPRGRPAFTIEALPVAMFNDMDALGAGNLPIALADWMAAYEIVDRGGIRVLRDPFTAKGSGEVEIDFYKRVGGAVVNFDAIKLAKCATS